MSAIILNQRNSYYAQLSDEGKLRFLDRVQEFLEGVDIIGRDGMAITEDMKMQIAAAAVQLTFGLERSDIPSVQTINIFPTVFYSKLYNVHFKGLTTKNGIVSISWNDFEQGYANDSDRLNLGLHELAHALHISIDDGSWDKNVEELFYEWQEYALQFFRRLKNREIRFLRSYGASNMHEFFAVCVEHFFELPHEFRTELPLLYGRTALLLNQDPINKNSDYVFLPQEYEAVLTVPLPEPITAHFDSGNTTNEGEEEQNFSMEQESSFQKFIRVYGINVAMGATFAGLFIGIPLLIWFTSLMLMPIEDIFLYIFIGGILGLVQWPFVKRKIDMVYHQFAMYAFSGFGMWFTIALLTLNLVTNTGTYEEQINMNFVYVNGNTRDIIVGDENSPLSKNLHSYFSTSENTYSPDARVMVIQYTKGILGYPRISGVRYY